MKTKLSEIITSFICITHNLFIMIHVYLFVYCDEN